MKTFTGLVTRGNENWIVNVQGLPGGNTVIAMGRTWNKARENAQEGVETVLKEPAGSVVIVLKFEDGDLEKLVEEVMWKKMATREAQDELSATLGIAVRKLTQHASVRDVAEMLGYSHQYIAKLAPRG